eukprot:scaffold22605_cov192-Cylindrotheca_fusiformis.AAC.5
MVTDVPNAFIQAGRSTRERIWTKSVHENYRSDGANANPTCSRCAAESDLRNAGSCSALAGGTIVVKDFKRIWNRLVSSLTTTIPVWRTEWAVNGKQQTIRVHDDDVLLMFHETEASSILAEAKLVGIDDYATNNLWTNLFLEEQGYPVERNVLHQDNKSAILLEEVNGQKSAGKQSRAINIRYFFITDQVKKGNISTEYCPTDDAYDC